MQATIPLTADTLLMGFASSGRGFKFEKEVSSVDIDGRTYKIIEGLTKDRLFGNIDKVYGVATIEESAKGWRLALLAQENHPFGFNLLIGQVEEPTFTDLPKPCAKAATGLACKDKDGSALVRKVLTPYQLPVTSGTKVGKKKVEEVGVPIFHGDNDSALLPLRFHGGTCGIIHCRGTVANPFMSNNKEANSLIARSSKMPVIREGIGSGVWHIIVHEGEQTVLIKSYYNDKAGRKDEIHR